MKESSLLLLLAELRLLVVVSLLKSGLRVGRRAVAISNQFLCWFSQLQKEDTMYISHHQKQPHVLL